MLASIQEIFSSTSRLEDRLKHQFTASRLGFHLSERSSTTLRRSPSYPAKRLQLTKISRESSTSWDFLKASPCQIHR